MSGDPYGSECHATFHSTRNVVCQLFRDSNASCSCKIRTSDLLRCIYLQVIRKKIFLVGGRGGGGWFLFKGARGAFGFLGRGPGGRGGGLLHINLDTLDTFWLPLNEYAISWIFSFCLLSLLSRC